MKRIAIEIQMKFTSSVWKVFFNKGFIILMVYNAPGKTDSVNLNIFKMIYKSELFLLQ